MHRNHLTPSPSVPRSLARLLAASTTVFVVLVLALADPAGAAQSAAESADPARALGRIVGMLVPLALIGVGVYAIARRAGRDRSTS